MHLPPLENRITAANAREMAARSWEARRAAKAAEAERARVIKAAMERNFQWVLRPETGFAPYFSRVLRAW
jgi:hypothetical protein